MAALPDLHVSDSSEAMLSGRKPPFRLLVRAAHRDGRKVNIRHAVSEGFVVSHLRLFWHTSLAFRCLAMWDRERHLKSKQGVERGLSCLWSAFCSVDILQYVNFTMRGPNAMSQSP